MNSQLSPFDSQPRMHVHIERLVLDSLVSGASDGEVVRAALEAELARQMAPESLNFSSGVLARISAPMIQLKFQNDPAELGRQIGQAVCGAVSQFNGAVPGNQAKGLSARPNLTRRPV